MEKKKAKRVTKQSKIRAKAEAQLVGAPRLHYRGQDDPEALLYELQVHQVELRMQNEELRKAHRELEQSRDRYYRLFELAPVGYLTLDPKGTILKANSAASSLLGMKKRALVGRHVSGFMDEGDADRFHFFRKKMFAKPGRHKCEVRLQPNKGDAFPALLEGASAAEQPAPARFLCVIVDLTDLRQAQAELRHAKKMRAIGTLASGLAHDFNNALQAILGAAYMAEEETSSSHEQDKHLRQIRQTAKRAGTLAQRLLMFGRKRESHLEPSRIDELVASSSELMRRLVSDDIRLVVDLQAPRAVIMADPIELEQILLNLASNARDAMPDGGQLTVRTEVLPNGSDSERPGRGDHVRLQVEDTGVGMDAATQARIFEPFFTTKEVGKGTGLGLSTVFAIAEGSGGHVEIESKVGRGTRVSVSFPCVDEPASTAPTTGCEMTLQGKALVVEDDPAVRATVTHYLGQLGLDALVAGDPEEAIALSPSPEGLDVIITDVVMPQMYGRELATRLLADHPEAQVLFVSAHSRPDLVSRGILSHDAAFLQKPFEKRELGEKLLSIMADAPLRERPATVVVVDDEEIARTSMAYFLEKRGYQVFACGEADQALEAIRDTPNAVDVLLTDLRLPNMPGSKLAEQARSICPQLPVIFVSGQADAPKMPGSYHLLKPIDLDRLGRTIDDALRTPTK